MTLETVALTLASYKGEMTALRELFSNHTTQDMEQFTAMSESLKEINKKMDELLLREARSEGESAGMRRSAVLMAGTVSFLISGAGLALRYVG